MIAWLAACVPALDLPSVRANPAHDFDGDGLSEQEGDCDDDDRDVGAEAAWYADGDGDGQGSDVVAVVACHAPDGFVAVAGDCDDGDAGVYAGASEVCNDRSDDCDEEADEGIVVPTWFPDADGDLHGDPQAASVTACEPPDGWVEDATDCDDGDPDVHPAAAEVCGNGIDDDCAAPPACACWLADSTVRLLGDTAADMAGHAMATLPAGDAVVIGSQEAGRAWVVGAGGLAGASGATALSATGLALSGDAGFGSAVAAGDAGGDGIADVLIGAPETGAAYLFAVEAPEGEATTADATASWAGDPGWFGVRVALADLDGAAGDEVVVAVADPTVPAEAGLVRAYLPEAADPFVTVRGDANALFALALARVPDDAGADRLAVGAYEQDTVWLIEGGALAGEVAVADVARELANPALNDANFGRAIAAFDADGDGNTDLLVGAPAASAGAYQSLGKAWLLLGPDFLPSLELVGGDEGAKVGTAVASAGDLDGDGQEELAVGAEERFGVGSPMAAFLVHAKEGTLTLDGNEHGEVTYVRRGDVHADDVPGTALARLEGWDDGDAIPDLLVGDPMLHEGGDDPGGAWLVSSTLWSPP
ncbi:MAG: MopE-related protein [Myxococcota bacterium]